MQCHGYWYRGNCTGGLQPLPVHQWLPHWWGQKGIWERRGFGFGWETNISFSIYWLLIIDNTNNIIFIHAGRENVVALHILVFVHGWFYLFCPITDASKDLKTILLSLLEMVASKKVSGHGRDQALNLLSKNVPRKIRKEKDNSRTLFTIDHGKLESFHSLPSHGSISLLP